MRFTKPLVASTALLLSACGSPDDVPGPTGMTQSEASALDDAAEMVEQRRLPPDATASPTPQPGPNQSAPAP